MDTDDKTVRDAGVRAIVDEFEATLDEEYKEEHGANLGECVDKLQKKIVRRWLANGKRVDGRGLPRFTFCRAYTVPACLPAVRLRF